MHICTFAGHSFVFSATVEDHLRDEIEAYLFDKDEASLTGKVEAINSIEQMIRIDGITVRLEDIYDIAEEVVSAQDFS